MEKTNFKVDEKYLKESFKEVGVYENTDENGDIEIFIVYRRDDTDMLRTALFFLKDFEQIRELILNDAFPKAQQEPKPVPYKEAKQGSCTPMTMLSEDFVLKLIKTILNR